MKMIKNKIWIFALLLLIILPSTYALSIIQSKIYYSFDLSDRNSTDIFNLVINGTNNGQINGGNFIGGKLGTAWNNTQGTENITNRNNIALNITSNFSVAFWFKRVGAPSIDDQTYITSARSPALNGFQFNFVQNRTTISDTTRFQITKSGVASNEIDTINGLNSNVSYFIVGTYNGSNNQMRLYLNGTLVSTGTFTQTGLVEVNDRLVIGQLANASDRNFNLTIDEFSFWNKTLTQDEISILYGNSYGFNPFKSNFTIYAVDSTIKANLNQFNLTANGTAYQSGSGINITTIINASQGSLINITNIKRHNYTSSDILNWNISEVLVINMTFQLVNTFNITIFDEILDKKIDWLNLTLEIFSPDVFSSNFTTTNGSILTNVNVPSDYYLRYSDTTNATYFERTYFTILEDGSTPQLTLYLLNKSYGNIVSSTGSTISITDTVNTKLEDAIINVNKYFFAGNTYKTVERLRTNFEGKTTSFLTNDEFYRFVIEYQNQTRFSSSPTKIFETTLTFVINLLTEATKSFNNFKGIAYNLSFSNITNIFTLTYNDANKLVGNVCLEIWRQRFPGDTLNNQSCSSSQSGTILLGVPVTNGTTFIAKAYASFSPPQLLASKFITFRESLPFDANKNSWFIVLMMTLVLIFLAVWSPIIALIIAPVGIILSSALGLVNISVGISMALALSFLILIFVIGRNR